MQQEHQQPTQGSEYLEKTAGTLYKDDEISEAKRSLSFDTTTTKDVISEEQQAISSEAPDAQRFNLAISTANQMFVEKESGASEYPSTQSPSYDVLGANKEQNSSKPDNTAVNSQMHYLESPKNRDEVQNLLDSTFPECEEKQIMPEKENDSFCRPVDCEVNCAYVPMSVEEVSVVTSLECWTNTKVRIVGKFLVPDVGEYIFSGLDKDKGDIRLNLSNLDQYPKHGEILEIFGELENLQENGTTVIILRVMFCNRVQNFHLYTRALSMVKPFVPSFIKRH